MNVHLLDPYVNEDCVFDPQPRAHMSWPGQAALRAHPATGILGDGKNEGLESSSGSGLAIPGPEWR